MTKTEESKIGLYPKDHVTKKKNKVGNKFITINTFKIKI